MPITTPARIAVAKNKFLMIPLCASPRADTPARRLRSLRQRRSRKQDADDNGGPQVRYFDEASFQDRLYNQALTLLKKSANAGPRFVATLKLSALGRFETMNAR